MTEKVILSNKPDNKRDNIYDLPGNDYKIIWSKNYVYDRSSSSARCKVIEILDSPTSDPKASCINQITPQIRTTDSNQNPG